MLTQYKALAFAGLVSLGCEQQEETGRSDIVPYTYLPSLREHPEETIEGAEEILGLDLVPWEGGSGAVVIVREDDADATGASKTVSRT